jgi:hypothetical protein
MPTYEMLWDCSSCGTTKLLGKTHRRCPNCGAAQDAKKRYFPPPGEEVAVEGHVFVGVDWHCGACQTPNSRAAEFCVNCGHPREGNVDVALVTDGPAKTDAQGAAVAPPDEPGALRATPEFHFAAERQEAEAAAPETRGVLRRYAGRLAAGGAGLLAAFFAVAVLWTEKVEVVVERHEWVREIDIERMAARSDSAWCDSMPGDAYNVSRSREERSTRQVADGQECHDVRRDNGDGTFSTSRECSTKYRSEPVYDDRCRFTVNRWGLERTARSDGVRLIPEPAWPMVRVSGGSCLGCEREGARRETLTVALRGRADHGKTWRCDIDSGRWRALGDGELREIEVRVLTGGAVCDTLQP